MTNLLTGSHSSLPESAIRYQLPLVYLISNSQQNREVIGIVYYLILKITKY